MNAPRHSDYLGGAPQFEMRSEADQLRGALGAVRAVTAEQGQVMSAALANNESLWNTNKRLRTLLAQQEQRAVSAEARANALQRKLEAIPDGAVLAELQAENDGLRKGIELLKNELSRSMHPELDTDQRKAHLQRLANQRAELDASGLVPTSEELGIEDARRDEKYGVFNPIPGETAEQYANRTGKTFEE
jgi:hypothetical protein